MNIKKLNEQLDTILEDTTIDTNTVFKSIETFIKQMINNSQVSDILSAYNPGTDLLFIDNPEFLERSLWMGTKKAFENYSSRVEGMPASDDAIIIAYVDYESTRIELVIEGKDLADVSNYNSKIMQQVKECVITYVDIYMQDITDNIIEQLKEY